MYNILIKNKIIRNVRKMPAAMQDRLAILLEDLREHGPVAANWPNFSKLGTDEYHCHLGHKWVACWRCQKGTIEIEVYYAGSREDAPY